LADVLVRKSLAVILGGRLRPHILLSFHPLSSVRHRICENVYLLIFA
jgi:hypothetical protein